MTGFYMKHNTGLKWAEEYFRTGRYVVADRKGLLNYLEYLG